MDPRAKSQGDRTGASRCDLQGSLTIGRFVSLGGTLSFEVSREGSTPGVLAVWGNLRKITESCRVASSVGEGANKASIFFRDRLQEVIKSVAPCMHSVTRSVVATSIRDVAGYLSDTVTVF